MFAQSLALNAVDAIYIVNKDYNFIEVNSVACDTLGYTKEELLSMNVRDIDKTISQEQFQKLKETFYDKGNVPESIRSKHETKSGQSIDVEITASTIQLDGKTYRLFIVKDITLQKEQEYERTLLKFAFDNNHESSFLIDKSGKMLFVNEAYCNIHGYTLEEFSNPTVFDVNVDITKEDWPSHWQELKEKGHIIFESHDKRKDGSVFPIEVSANYFEYEGKEYNIGNMKDITQRKKIDYENALLRFAYNHSNDGAFLFTKAGEFKYVNQTYCKIQGYTAQELANMSVFDVDSELTQEQWEQFWSELKESKTLIFERTNTTSDGKVYPIEVSANFFEYEGQEYNIGFLRDISEQKSMQNELIKREQELRSLANNIPDNIARWDTKGRYLFANNTLTKTLGKTYEEIIGKTTDELFSNGEFKEVAEYIQQVIDTQKPLNLYKVGHANQEGKRRYDDISFTPEFDKDGNLISILSVGRNMTEYYKMQEEILYKEELYRFLAENMPANIALWDNETRHLYVNERLRNNTFKVAQETYIGKTIDEAFPNGEFEEIKNLVFQVIDTKQPLLLQRIPGSDVQEDEKLLFDLHLIPSFDAQNNVTSVLGVGIDMSEHYRMQDEIEAKEELYRFLAENIPANIALSDKEGRYLYVNATHAEAMNIPAEEFIGKTTTELFPDGRFGKYKHLFSKIKNDKKTVELKKIPAPIHDTMQLHDVYIIPQLDKKQNVQSILSIGLDMTEHYKMQEEIEAKEEQLRNTVETIPGVVGIFHLKLDNSTHIPYISPNAKELLGYDTNTLMKNTKRVISLIHPKDFRSVQKEMMRSYKNMSAWSQEFRVIHPRKKELWVEINAKPMPHPEGGVMWYGYMHDVSERKTFEKQIGLASIGQLSAGITHEINTPLTYVKGRLEIMQFIIDDIKDETIKTEMLESIESLHDGVVRMSRIVESMREIAGKNKGIKEKVDIYHSFIVTLIMLRNRSKYITSIYINGEEFFLDIKQNDKKFFAFVEQQRVEQVWIILFNNALDALEHNRKYEDAKIEIFIEDKGNDIGITIQDNAGGIPDDLLPVIFEPFTSTKEHGGMGLGLNIAKKIIDEQDGSIEIMNNKEGAILKILLPKGV